MLTKCQMISNNAANCKIEKPAGDKEQTITYSALAAGWLAINVYELGYKIYTRHTYLGPPDPVDFLPIPARLFFSFFFHLLSAPHRDLVSAETMLIPFRGRVVLRNNYLSFFYIYLII